jgi:hypothetical protein
MKMRVNDTIRARTQDGNLAFFVNQLDNLDRRLYQPLVSVTWGRDIKLREDVTMAFESTSFIRSSFGGNGTLNSEGLPFISQESTTLQGVSIDGEMITSPIHLLGREVSYSSVELERSQYLGRSIDSQKIDALNTMYQMAVDRMVYVGSSEVGAEGLLNSSQVTAAQVVNGAGGTKAWNTKTADEILNDVNTLLDACWSASAYAVCPDKLLLPPTQFSYILSQKVSTAGNISILQFLKENCICNATNGRPLDIQPVKWLAGAGTGGDDRMVCYTNDINRVRFPMVPIRREMPYYKGINFIAPYIWAMGAVEFVYPETVRYADSI